MTMYLTAFDHLIQSKSLLTHWYYEQKWNNGELTLDDLKIYAKEYYHLVKRIPGVVSRVRDRALERGEVGEFLSHVNENIEEETEHIALWKRFAKSVGVTEQEIESYEPTEKTKKAVAMLEELADSSLEDGVAMMYAVELDLPAIAKTKKDGLCKHYGLTSDDAHVYFDAHLNEEEHFVVWQGVAVDKEKALAAVEKSLAAQHLLLDGVCEASGFEKDCDC